MLLVIRVKITAELNYFLAARSRLIQLVWKLIKWFGTQQHLLESQWNCLHFVVALPFILTPIYAIQLAVPDIKHIHDAKLKHDQAVELLRHIFKEIPRLSNEQLETIGLDKAIYDAIKHGMIEFIDEIIQLYPEIIWRKDKKGRTLFANAIVLRQEKVFNHVLRLGLKQRISLLRHDIFRNNFLHLAAKLSPPSRLDRISGAALQMQRELQWFEVIHIFYKILFYIHILHDFITDSVICTYDPRTLPIRYIILIPKLYFFWVLDWFFFL